MNALAWTYKSWSGGHPCLGSDESWRHVLVLPLPFTRRAVDGEQALRALALVVAPWWLCREALTDRQVRAWVRWERHRQADLRLVDRLSDGDPSDDALEIVERRWTPSRPPWPHAWTAPSAVAA